MRAGFDVDQEIIALPQMEIPEDILVELRDQNNTIEEVEQKLALLVNACKMHALEAAPELAARGE